MLPSMGGFLTYLKGLRPRNRIGFAFGSFGWGGQAVGEIEKVMHDLKWDIPHESIKLAYVPDDTELVALKQVAHELGDILNSK